MHAFRQEAREEKTRGMAISIAFCRASLDRFLLKRHAGGRFRHRSTRYICRYLPLKRHG
jgi:hypothetical protein